MSLLSLILTPSIICFRGVTWPLAMDFARPRRYAIAASAAARSNVGAEPDRSRGDKVFGVGGMSSASSMAQLDEGFTGVKCMGIVVVWVIVRTDRC